jgi:hypothetical protein
MRGDFNNSFPDDSDALVIGWLGPSMNAFWNNYLVPNRAGTVQDPRSVNDVLFCPTERFHRLYEASNPGGVDDNRLVGYFYLPGQEDVHDWTSAYGTEPWLRRKKLGGDYRRAPVLIDKNEALGGTAGATNMYAPGFNWVYTDPDTHLSAPIGTHLRAGNIPEGGNFLFEDGHVDWVKGENISVGALVIEWQCFFRIKIDR